MRADAQRNRARVLEVAIETFGAEGLSVPIHEIARRAGVGTGTVSRHFPTKEVLHAAIVSHIAERLVAQSRELRETEDPGTAFFSFFASMVREGAVNRGLGDALAGAGFDVEAAADRADHNVLGALGELLTRAQQAGAVRADVELADVKALIVGCVARERGPADRAVQNHAARDRMVAIARDGLRAGAQ